MIILYFLKETEFIYLTRKTFIKRYYINAITHLQEAILII